MTRETEKGRAFRPSDFDPYARTDRRVAGKAELALLKEALEARKGR